MNTTELPEFLSAYEAADKWKFSIILDTLYLEKKKIARGIEVGADRPRYVNNDYVNNFYDFMRDHSTEEVIAHMIKIHPMDSDRSFSAVFDEIYNELSLKQQIALKLIYQENKTHQEAVKEMSELKMVSPKASTINLTIQSAQNHIMEDNGLEKLFYNAKDFEKLITWDSTPLDLRYADIMDAKIMELEIPDNLKMILFSLAWEHVSSKKPSVLVTIKDIYNYLGDLRKITGCGIKKEKTIKDYIFQLLDSHSEQTRNISDRER